MINNINTQLRKLKLVEKIIRNILFTFVLTASLQNSLYSMNFADTLKHIVTSEPAKIAAFNTVPFLAGSVAMAFANEKLFFKKLAHNLYYDKTRIIIPVALSTAIAQLGKWPKVSANDLLKPSLIGYLALGGILVPTVLDTISRFNARKNNPNQNKHTSSPSLRYVCNTFGSTLAGYSFITLPLYALAKRIQAGM
jgi:hypothetical protein